MPTSYPSALDNFTNPTPTTQISVVSHAQQHSNANDAIEAIEAELGTNPSGSAATVRERIEAIESDIAAIPPPVSSLPYYSITGGTSDLQGLYWDTDGGNFDLAFPGGNVDDSGKHPPTILVSGSTTQFTDHAYVMRVGEMVMLDGEIAYAPSDGIAVGLSQKLQKKIESTYDRAGVYWHAADNVYKSVFSGGDVNDAFYPPVRVPYGSFADFEGVSYSAMKGEIIMVDGLLYYGADAVSFDEMIPVQTALSQASTGYQGKIQLATDAEVQTGTDVNKAVTPSSLSARTATETRTGVVELATNAETVTGTDNVRAVTPAGLAAKLATLSSAVLQTDVFTTTGANTWTKAAGCKLVEFHLIGGGGGGGGTRSGASHLAGMGGGAGCYVHHIMQAAEFSSTETVTVGAGGAGGNGANGANGGTTSFGTKVKAFGGVLGKVGGFSGDAQLGYGFLNGRMYTPPLTANPGSGATGTVGKTPSSSDGYRIVAPTGGGGGAANGNYAGAQGGYPYSPNPGESSDFETIFTGFTGKAGTGGTGSAAGVAQNGGNGGSIGIIGIGGGGGGGSGGAVQSSNGGNGGLYGGGGGGAGGNNGTGGLGTGGNGANGIAVIIQYG